jgi:hypothetical protein
VPDQYEKPEDRPESPTISLNMSVLFDMKRYYEALRATQRHRDRPESHGQSFRFRHPIQTSRRSDPMVDFAKTAVQGEKERAISYLNRASTKARISKTDPVFMRWRRTKPTSS